MNASEQNKFKSIFSNMKNEIFGKAEQASANLTKLNTGDVVDQTANERDIQVLLKLQGRDRFMLMKIEHAENRIVNGTFGQCEECDGDISISRLTARPIATQCICCKEEQEQEESKIDYKKRSKTTGISLRNSGDNLITFPEDAVVARSKSNKVNLKQWQDSYEAAN